MLTFALLACSTETPVWAVHHASLEPTATGATGTQTWEMFTAEWAKNGKADEFLCARAQLVTGAVITAPEGCTGCVAAYDLAFSELESDCAAPLDTDAAFATPVSIGIGDLPAELEDLDPWPGRSLGWYISVDGVTMSPYGFAYAEGLDWEGALGAPGWVAGQLYTLWPAYAWDLRE